LGGDEFCILLNDINQFDDAAKVAARIVRSFGQSMVIGDNELFVTASVGIAVFPNDGEDPETLLKNADAAMYHAKSQGRNNYQFYGRAMNARASEKLAMEAQLRKAIERNEFEIHLQPKLDLRSDRIAGAEALIRWRHPERGMVLPGDFIPLAEQGGMIVPVGEWVLQAACQQSMTWLQAGLPPTPVAVNISSLHFRHRTLLSTVARVLENTGLPPQLLELELTESILMEDIAATLATLRSLKGMGLRLSIDDFGTGYSSLAYLKRFPLDALKVDRSFVKDMSAAADDTAIPSAIIAMAHSLKLEVVAEGVETQEQMAFLKERGCEYAQGYFIGRPMAAPQLTTILERSAKSAPG
jgi:EAL domain-containing protein (putative c-di-GMP-specific phosphodiesterase class I)